ncbi:apoptosis-inducing factor [Moniliophthora roreri]|uniref:Putative FAD/NAD(P)-binding domain-containing protein n=1 Tax=Moniliophthora roreri TaxID=221103 RepID=A0A0W0G4Z7_MONRR|nr:apoptosis-inducing factor [Moniliophthora roreri]
MASKRTDDKTTILIVGGGAAGINIVKPLSKSLDPAKYNIVLVNPRPYILFLIPALRMVVSDQDHLEDQIMVPYDRLFHNGNGTFVQGEVTKINQRPGDTRGEVVLDNGETLDYNILVLATGAKWDGPLAFPKEHSEVNSFISSRREEFAKSQNILLVGGGTVGIELAGEIRDVWPSKQVTIIQRDRLLLNSTYPDKFRVAMQKQVEGRGIRVILDDSIGAVEAGVSKGAITTHKGKTLQPDLIVRTWGAKPDTDFIGSSLGPDTLTSRGHVKVKPTLQLPQYPNIFAIGDIIDWNEQKQAGKIGGHVSVVLKNITSYLSGKAITSEYKGSTEMILITNGKNSGLMYLDVLWGLMFGSWLSSLLKAKTLMVSMLRSQVGY